ncbi:thioredoxin family protein [Altererythrobacter sp. ZODW24]|uniref:thioredoxin family protein n=1 Tax=Altererythrobacter sp. ZODW24 TaxID=2185142 RepID=UPI000DF78D00|nr:thioredoxin family protein [Altererythrobacter sp. ZODW24]
MRALGFSLLLAALALSGCATSSAQSAHPEVRAYSAESDASAEVDAALERANAKGRNVLVVLGANWCHDSRAFAGWMETPRFQAMLAERFETAYVDVGYPQGDKGRNIDIAQRFGVEEVVGTPTVLILSPDGTLLNADTAGTWRNTASRSEGAIFE